MVLCGANILSQHVSTKTFFKVHPLHYPPTHNIVGNIGKYSDHLLSIVVWLTFETLPVSRSGQGFKAFLSNLPVYCTTVRLATKNMSIGQVAVEDGGLQF